MANFYGQFIGFGAGVSEAGYTFQGSSYGYRAGAFDVATTTIEKWSLSADLDAVDVGNLTVGRGSNCGNTSPTHGYFAGGANGVSTGADVIERYSFATGVQHGEDQGDLSEPHNNVGGGASSETDGYIAGGGNAEIDKWSFSSASGGSHIGDITQNVYGCVGHSDPAGGYGYRSGGVTGSTYQTQIDRWAFASDGDAVDTGADVTSPQADNPGSCSATDQGYTGGGHTGALYSDVIDRFTYSSSSTASDIGNLESGNIRLAGVSGTTHGYFAGGRRGGPSTDIIQKFAYASVSDATDIANSTEATYSSGTSQY